MRRGKEYADSFGNEMRFWLENMSGHGRIIAERTVGLGEPAEQAEEFSYVFTRFGQRLDKVKGGRKTDAFLQELTDVTQDFMTYQGMLLTEKLNGRLGENIHLFSLEHMLREGECWQSVLRCYDGERLRRVIRISEVVSWFTAAAEHTMLLRQLLEPAERRLQNMFGEYEREWFALLTECRQLADMTVKRHIGTEALRVFVSEMRSELNDFAKACQMLLEIKGVGRPVIMLSAFELEHIKNENEHFLYLLSMLNRYGAADNEQIAAADAELCTVEYEAEPESETAATEGAGALAGSELLLKERAGTEAEPVVAVIELAEEPSVGLPVNLPAEQPAKMLQFDTAPKQPEQHLPPAGEIAKSDMPAAPVETKKVRLVLPRQMAGACPNEQMMKKASAKIRPLGSKG